ncbi:MAG: ATP-binding protein [Campylobacter sp.]|nr:ATP-binding protein [Campylobacter sp.]
MLVKFAVKNFLSFKDEAVFDMRADSNDDEISSTLKNDKILKVAVLYGANASGKTNLLKAISFMRNTVLNIAKTIQSTDILPYVPFLLSTTTKDSPSKFEIVFVSNDIKYTYGYENDATTIYKEYLYENKNGRNAKLFERDTNNGDYVNPDRFKEGFGYFDKSNKKIKISNNRLFIWKCDEDGGEISKSILKWFSDVNLLSSFESVLYHSFTINQIKNNENFKKKVADFISQMDTGIDDVFCSQEPQPNIPNFILEQFSEKTKKDIVSQNNIQIVARTVHKLFDDKNNFIDSVFFELNQQESLGTKNLFSIIGPMFDALQNGKVLLIDELEASLHPHITRTLISLFNSKANASNAQLVFTAHDTNFMKLFKREQIWFTQKDKYGASELYSLLDIKGVRNNEKFEKQYNFGTYGAIPYIQQNDSGDGNA